MTKEIKSYFEKLEGLSAEELSESVEELVRTEKRNVALVIAHIAEMSRRKAELACGYKNIFDYCVRRLNLSEGSVARRLQVANVSRRFPQILVALAENRISLTVAGHLAPHLREDNVDRLLSDCAGITKRAVEEYVVALRPKPLFNPSIRKKPTSKAECDPAQPEGQKETAQEREQPKESHPVASAEEKPGQRLVKEIPNGPPRSPSANVLEPACPDIFNFRFAANGDFKAKFERLAEVLGVENPLKNMAEVFEKALDISLEKKDPKKKLERRLERESKQSAGSFKSRPGKIRPEGSPDKPEGKGNSRYIPSEVRERVLARADHQCEYKAKDGMRCSSKTGLQIEHSRPFAIYRSHEERFLKALCRRHNLFQAERVYGAGYIRAKIEEKKNQKVSLSGVRQSFTSTLSH